MSSREDFWGDGTFHVRRHAMQDGVCLRRDTAIQNILFSLRNEVSREMAEIEVSKCLIDTSPFFAGATQLSWHATDALIIPVRTDQQSVNSLMLLLKILSDP